MKSPCIIADLDNTIADTTHRSHFLSQTPKAWDAFHAACVNDEPMWHVIELLTAMDRRGFRIIITSGRDAAVKDQTADWLMRHSVPYDELILRPHGDFTEDSALKERFLNELILPRYEPLFALDDRDRVVAMWRRRGIPCLQVREGNF